MCIHDTMVIISVCVCTCLCVCVCVCVCVFPAGPRLLLWLCLLPTSEGLGHQKRLLSEGLHSMYSTGGVLYMYVLYMHMYTCIIIYTMYVHLPNALSPAVSSVGDKTALYHVLQLHSKWLYCAEHLHCAYCIFAYITKCTCTYLNCMIYGSVNFVFTDTENCSRVFYTWFCIT